VQEDDKVCTDAPGNVCYSSAPASVSLPFKNYSGASSRLHVIVPGETIAEGKCDGNLDARCLRTDLNVNDPPGRNGLPTPYELLGAGGPLKPTVYVIDDFFNITTDRVGLIQDSNPVAVMPNVSLFLPGDATAQYKMSPSRPSP